MKAMAGSGARRRLNDAHMSAIFPSRGAVLLEPHRRIGSVSSDRRGFEGKARMTLNTVVAAVGLSLAALIPAAASAQSHGDAAHGGAHTPYAGFETREIASLSPADLAEIRRGGGWGLALPAELNGLPGPAHVLELREELGLSNAQAAQIEAVFASMREAAVLAGEEFIAAERALDAALASSDVDPVEIQALIDAAAAARGRLRYAHISAHFSTRDLLTEGQIAEYQVLRGYAPDVCSRVPDGHDPAMWRRHNDC